MTIKQNGGVFGRNPTFNDVTIEGQLTFDGDIDVNSDLKVDGNLDVTGTGDFGGKVKVTTAGNGEIDVARTGGALINLQAQSATGIIGTNSNHTLQLKTNGGARLKITTAGNVEVMSGNLVIGTSGKGIDFSATAGTGTSELLDDYEEGVWTPNLLNGTSITYTTTPTGNYTKIGNMVHITASIDVSNSDTADASALTIGGLPFNAINDTMTFTLGRYRSFLSTKGAIVLGSVANASFIQLFESNNDFILYSEIGSSGILTFSGSYLT
tara:strand:- start:1535 stop:2338 length:804 start_codon:yes stop_codon:yes gene_type:complete